MGSKFESQTHARISEFLEYMCKIALKFFLEIYFEEKHEKETCTDLRSDLVVGGKLPICAERKHMPAVGCNQASV